MRTFGLVLIFLSLWQNWCAARSWRPHNEGATEAEVVMGSMCAVFLLLAGLLCIALGAQ